MELHMKNFLAFLLLAIATMGVPALALDCNPPAEMSIKLYIGAERGTVNGMTRTLAPGETAPEVHTCAVGTITDARAEPQWEYFEAVWKRYEQYILPHLETSPLTTGSAESYSPRTIMFVTMPDLSGGKAAEALANLVEFASRQEVHENGTTAYLDSLEWQPHYAAKHPTIVFDDGQVLVVREVNWREACNSLDITLSIKGDVGVAAEYELSSEGFADECSVNFRLLR